MVKGPKVQSRDATINLHKRLHGLRFKKKAPRAIAAIRRFVQEKMGTSDVRVDADLNKFIWHKGVRNVPYRVRLRMSRRVNEDEDGDDEGLYTHVMHVPVDSYKDLVDEQVDDTVGEAHKLIFAIFIL